MGNKQQMRHVENKNMYYTRASFMPVYSFLYCKKKTILFGNKKGENVYTYFYSFSINLI